MTASVLASHFGRHRHRLKNDLNLIHRLHCLQMVSSCFLLLAVEGFFWSAFSVVMIFAVYLQLLVVWMRNVFIFWWALAVFDLTSFRLWANMSHYRLHQSPDGCRSFWSAFAIWYWFWKAF